jgi:hypothetical protein
MDELKVLLNKKVVGIAYNTIYFEGGYALSVSEYESYLEKYKKEDLRLEHLHYFSPSYFKMNK